MVFLATTRRLVFGSKSLPKRASTIRLLNLVVPKTATSSVCKVVVSSFTTMVKTGGAVVADLIKRQSATRVVLTVKYSTTSARKTMPQAMA
ncbi:hypothetical protein D3C72_1344660 [compost metagenome]